MEISRGLVRIGAANVPQLYSIQNRIFCLETPFRPASLKKSLVPLALLHYQKSPPKFCADPSLRFRGDPNHSMTCIASKFYVARKFIFLLKKK